MSLIKNIRVKDANLSSYVWCLMFTIFIVAVVKYLEFGVRGCVISIAESMNDDAQSPCEISPKGREQEILITYVEKWRKVCVRERVVFLILK